MSYISLKQDNGQPFLIFINDTPKNIIGKKLYEKDGFYIDNQKGLNGLITCYFKSIKLLKQNINKKYLKQIQ